PLLKYLGAVELYFFGFSEFFLRSIGVIFGLGTVILTYLIARKYYSRKTAIFAMVVVAFSMIHINFSRTFLTEPVLAFFFTASFYAYVNLLKGDKNRRGILILGVCLAFALLSKWIGLNLIIVIIIHALYTKLIRVHVKKKFSFEIEGWLFKALIVFIIVFFLVWPMALYPIKLDVDVKVVGMEDRGDSFVLGVPTILLSPQEYLTVALGRQEKVAEPSILPVMQIPFIGYVILMFSKESLLFAALFLLGLFAIYKKRKSMDNDILIFIGVFLFILWLQKYGQTYRYLTVIMPLIALVTARSLDLIKNPRSFFVLGIIFSLVLFSTAALVHPYYNLHYNSIGDFFGFKQLKYDQEIANTDGLMEAIDYVKANCTKVTGSLAGTIINYVENYSDIIVNEPKIGDVPICFYTQPGLESSVRILESNLSIKCDIVKEIQRSGIKLRSIYSCE
ncbi:MAG TPA: phospholipid carrier-dependent glycosyltransferase, partial [archaeon]|nr:phospholipid carrier-dependent glycosyltransferase [archaeon]